MSDRLSQNFSLFSEDLFPLNYLAAQEMLNKKKELENLLDWADSLECLNCLFDGHDSNDRCKKYDQRLNHQINSISNDQL